MEKAKEISSLFPNKVHRDQLVTLGDLQEFKEDLLISIKSIIQINAPLPTKKWLKSYEVKKLMNISTGTLQNLRANGTLPHSKIGGSIYYDADLINQVLAGQKKNHQATNPKNHKVR
jgi:Helix-turn-helix domain